MATDKAAVVAQYIKRYKYILGQTLEMVLKVELEQGIKLTEAERFENARQIATHLNIDIPSGL